LPHRGGRIAHALERLRVADAMSTEISRISARATVSQAIEQIGSLEHSTFPVVDDGNGFVGMITKVRLRRLAADHNGSEEVGSHVDQTPYVLAEYPLLRAMVRMDKAGVRQVAVIDREDGNKLIGLLTMSDIVRAHAQAAVDAGDPDSTVVPEFAETVVDPDLQSRI
jgi:CBS domain containing-hemolysin-like protein